MGGWGKFLRENLFENDISLNFCVFHSLIFYLKYCNFKEKCFKKRKLFSSEGKIPQAVLCAVLLRYAYFQTLGAKVRGMEEL